MTTTHPQLVPLATATFQVAAPLRFPTTGAGTRVIGEITEARVGGPRLRATLAGRAAADWAVVEPTGRILADVRLTLETDDGALILMQYQGRGDARTGITHSAPLFETGDERYLWLTRILTVARGRFDGTTMRYELYEVS